MTSVAAHVLVHTLTPQGGIATIQADHEHGGMKRPDLSLALERWPYSHPIAISRGVLEIQNILHATATCGSLTAQGEGEQHESDLAVSEHALARGREALRWIADGLDRATLRARMPADGLRNAIDAMLWDLECKRAGVRAWELAGLRGVDERSRFSSLMTVTLDTPEAMAVQARAWRDPPILKVKLGDRSVGGLDRDIERLYAVAAAAPTSSLTIDPNEGWDAAGLHRFAAAVAGLPVVFIEQPLPAGHEDLLPSIAIPVAADESCTTIQTLAGLAGKVQYVNIKLDKCGGLTEALLMCDEAQRLGLGLMIGCNCGTSLAMAPAFLVASRCEFVGLDGPLHMRDDRAPAMRYDDGFLCAPEAALWG